MVSGFHTGNALRVQRAGERVQEGDKDIAQRVSHHSARATAQLRRT